MDSAFVFLRRENILFHFHILKPSTGVKDDGEHVLFVFKARNIIYFIFTF